ILPWGPSGLKFDLRHAIANRCGKGKTYRLLGSLMSLIFAPFMFLEKMFIGLQGHWSWAIPASLRSILLVRQHHPELIYSTGGAYSAHLAALCAHRLTGCTWIAEIHDPMVTPGKTANTRNAKFMQKLESSICKYSTLCWWFTDTARDSAQTRNPQSTAKKLFILPGSKKIAPPILYTKSKKCIFAYFGSLSDTRSLLPLLKAINELLIQSKPDMPNMKLIEIHCYSEKLDKQSRDFIISNPQLQKYVFCFGRIESDSLSKKSRQELIFEKMCQSDYLLLLHGTIPECSEYIPYKLYEYFWTNRPVFALTHKNTLLNQLIIKRGGLVAEEAEITEIKLALIKAITLWAV
ncbi:MAG: hypothetical protein KGJ07_10420, partial [Patescibacteria group bacterium]|nr:hypothetical protein [Patescibacteria group bacterium]